MNLDRTLSSALELVVLGLTVLTPWAFGAVHPAALVLVYGGVAVALVLWAAVLIASRPALVACPVALALAGMVLLGLAQVAPLSGELLRVVSPATADLRADLVPAEAEGIAGEPAPRPTDTISLDPGATRAQVVKLLAVLALFAVVRYGLATPAAFRRFAVVCVANGAALSVFALAQKFSAAPDTVYWSFPSQGTVFGPFVCRNHFPFYVNVCFGLGVGLLLEQVPPGRGRSWGEALVELGRRPVALWLAAALGLMLAANLYSLSRGGAVALVGATVGCGVFAVAGGRRVGGVAALAVPVGLGLALVAWFGSDPVGRRLETLGGSALEEGRQQLWARTLPLARDYPLWGTGYGTFETIEPSCRAPGDEPVLAWQHAHNEYLEALVEGGTCQLLLVGLVLGLVYRAGVRAYRRDGSGLVLGSLFGLTTLVLHAAGDFGMHMPAIVILATVLAAHLTAAGTEPGRERTPGPWPAVGAAVACLVVAAILPVDGWRRARADHYRLAAVRAEARLPTGQRGPAVEYLEAAAAYTPDDALLRLRLADARYAEARAVGGDPGPALRDYLRARAANPLYAEPHVRLAGGRADLDHPDRAERYLERACRLEPAVAEYWYLAGQARLEAGNPEAAWADWRHSLACSPARLAAIAPEAHARLGVAGLIDRVLPPNPDLLTAAADMPALAADRGPLLARALDLTTADPTDPEALHRRARLLREVGRGSEAVDAYEVALARAPDRVGWRFELAELLFDRGDLRAAGEHVRQVLRAAPDHPGARELNAAVRRGR